MLYILSTLSIIFITITLGLVIATLLLKNKKYEDLFLICKSLEKKMDEKGQAFLSKRYEELKNKVFRSRDEL